MTIAVPYVQRSTCRLCGSVHVDPILDLGRLAFSAFPTPEEWTDRDQGTKAPLSLGQCRSCGLAQLHQTVAPELLYRQYWYRSSINETMQAELTAVVRAALLEVSVHPSDLIVDVGANDGFLLSQYPQQRAHWAAGRIAFEPAANLQADCQQHAEVLIGDFFPPPVGALEAWRHRVKILTSVAVFYDLDTPSAFVEAVDDLLHEDGVWIVQLQDLAQMVEATAFDNLCHEHLTYWSLASFERLLASCRDLYHTDLHVTHAEQRAINGGSLRIHVRREIYAEDQTVGTLRAAEQGSISWEALERFAWQTTEIRKQIQATLAVAGHWTSDLYGASTKANTLLQYCGIDHRVIRRAWERNPDKWGRVTATGIPIVSEAEGRGDPPTVLLAGIWQFRESLLVRERAYLEGGGRILFPLPRVDVVLSRAQSA